MLFIKRIISSTQSVNGTDNLNISDGNGLKTVFTIKVALGAFLSIQLIISTNSSLNVFTELFNISSSSVEIVPR